MKTRNPTQLRKIAASILAVLFLMATGACAVEQEEEGNLPEYEVEQTEEGQAPEYDVETGDVDVTTEEEQVTVPDVEVTEEEEQVTVPDVDIESPAEEAAEDEQQ